MWAPPIGVGAGLPANAVVAATVDDGGDWPAGPASSRVNPLLRGAVYDHRCVSTTNLCRGGFTRECGGGCDGGRRVEIGQQGRPLRG
ncbi:hypothetical protein METHP15_1120024 [Pseudomonas sp. P15-2025]